MHPAPFIAKLVSQPTLLRAPVPANRSWLSASLDRRRSCRPCRLCHPCHAFLVRCSRRSPRSSEPESRPTRPGADARSTVDPMSISAGLKVMGFEAEPYSYRTYPGRANETPRWSRASGLSPPRTSASAPTWLRVNQRRPLLLSLPTHALRAVGRMAAFAVGGVYRNPDSIDNCSRRWISCPGLDFSLPTGHLRQPVGRKGSFPLDCTQIAVKLHFDCSFGRVVGRRGGVLASARPPAACVLGNRTGGVR